MLRAWKRNTGSTYEIPDAYRNSHAPSSHENKGDIKRIGSQHVTLAYGSDQVPQLVRQLADDDPVIVRNAAEILCRRILRKPSHIGVAVQSGLISRLNGLAVAFSVVSDGAWDPETTVSAVTALNLTARNRSARAEMIRTGTLACLRKCMDKQSPPRVQKLAFDVLEALSEYRQIGKALVCQQTIADESKTVEMKEGKNAGPKIETNGLVRELFETTSPWVKRFSQKELDDIAYDNAAEEILTLESFGKGRMAKIEYEAACKKRDDAKRQRAAEKAAETRPEVLSQRLRIVRNLCKTRQGMEQALAEGGVGRCVRLLPHKAETVRKEACQLLQALTLGSVGRSQAIETGITDVEEGALLTTGVENKIKGGQREGAMLALVNVCLGGKREDMLATIRRAAMGTIAYMVVDLDGKECLLNADSKLKVIMLGLTKEKDAACRSYALKACASIACLPRAREKLLKAGAVDAVENLAKFAQDELQDDLCAAALEALLFKP